MKEGSLRILVIGAHPADIFDQSGGTMAHHTRKGDWVGAVILTHGARVHDKVISDGLFKAKEMPQGKVFDDMIADRADVKAQEVVRACEILGMKREDVFFLGADDSILLENRETIQTLARLMRRLRPNVLITHLPFEDGGIHTPHCTTGKMAMHAVSCAVGVDGGDPNPPVKIAQIFFFGQGAGWVRCGLRDTLHGFTNDVFIDITDVAELKLKTIDCLVSQGYAGAYARKRIEASDGAFGQRVGVAYAEAFIRWEGEVHEYLPVTPHALRTSRMSDHEVIAIRSFRIASSGA